MAAIENKKTLIVNYLPQTLTDEVFTQMFAAVGTLTSSKIVRDRSSGYSYGFGFVEYEDENHAAAAISQLNGTQLQNKTIKVAYSRQGEKVKGANLYVCNLPKTCTVEQLQEVFSAYGDIIQCRILTDQKTGLSKGIGFVLFNTRDQAELALSNLNLKTPENFTEPLQVSFAEDRGRMNQGNYMTQVYGPGGGGGGMEMYGATAGYGMEDYYGGGPETFYENTFDFMPKVAGFRGGMRGVGMRGGGAMRGLGGMRGGMPGSPMRGRGGIAGGMMRSRGASQRFNPMAPAGGVFGYGVAAAGDASSAAVPPSGHIVFAYNIGSATTEEDIRQLFSLYGSVVKVDVIWDFEKNTGKGFGFVTMPDYEEAAYAISQLNGYNYAGKPLQVSFKSGK